MKQRSSLEKASLITTLLATLWGANAIANDSPSTTGLNVDRAEQETQINMHYLLGNVLQKSMVLQKAYGGFSPYGAALFKGGSIKYVWYAEPGQMVENPAQSIPFIRRALQAQALSKKIVGSAVVYKSKATHQKAPQLTAELEYQTGQALAFASEMIIDTNNNVTWGNNTQSHFEPRVFVAEETDTQLSETGTQSPKTEQSPNSPQ